MSISFGPWGPKARCKRKTLGQCILAKSFALAAGVRPRIFKLQQQKKQVRWCVSCVFAERFDFVVVVSALQGCNSSAQRMQAVKCKYSIQQVKVRRSNVCSMHIFFSKVRLSKFLGSSKFLMKWKVPPPPKTVSHRFHNYGTLTIENYSLSPSCKIGGYAMDLPLKFQNSGV